MYLTERIKFTPRLNQNKEKILKMYPVDYSLTLEEVILLKEKLNEIYSINVIIGYTGAAITFDKIPLLTLRLHDKLKELLERDIAYNATYSYDYQITSNMIQADLEYHITHTAPTWRVIEVDIVYTNILYMEVEDLVDYILYDILHHEDYKKGVISEDGIPE